MSWPRGASVAVRSRPQGNVGYTFPATVVRDTLEWVVLFQPSGTTCKRRQGSRGGPNGRNLLVSDSSYVDVVSDRATFHAWVPDDHYWVIRRWTGSGFEGWYINLAAPWHRTAIGFDTLDQILDVEVADDLSSWRWKDEDELAWAVQTGRCTRREAEDIRRHGEEAVARMTTRSMPFHEAWPDLEPDPGWSVPSLPTGWERVDVE
jgi:predicted RNA-binding protein associated with RNAse of E/G family